MLVLHQKKIGDNVMTQVLIARPNTNKSVLAATGIYTEIVDIVAPDSAPAGSDVNVTIKIKNVDSVNHLISCVALYNGSGHFIDQFAAIPAGATHSFSGSFGMPGWGITIYAYSYYPIGADWILDDEATKDVNLSVVEWILVATRNISLDIAAPPDVWVLAATKSISLGIAAPPEIWVQAAVKSISLGIAAPPGVWVLLGTRTITIAVTGVPPPTCEIDADCPEGYVCVDGVCVPEEPEEEKKFPWTWVIIGAGATIGVIGLATAAKKKGVR